MNANDVVNELLNEDDSQYEGAKRRELAALVDSWVTDEANSTEVLATLQRLGVITPAEASHEDTHVEPGSKEHGAIHVFIYSPKRQILGVYEDGTTERQD
jgi:hypothetical protein